MKLIIPMTGIGARFQTAGYKVPKPLIEVEGKPIIAHVLDMFPGIDDILFICNEDHVRDFKIDRILRTLAPTADIAVIKAHKLGPVHAVMQVADKIDDASGVIVNYCDFTCLWDFPAFCDMVAKTECDGAIPCYRGFHPHMLHSTSFAYVKMDGERGVDIQEKQPFTDTPMDEYASSGTYYFKSGAVMKQAFKECMDQGLTVKDEYYVSMAYKPLMNQGRKIMVSEIDHFMQWGTPDDFQAYQRWSHMFRTLMSQTRPAQMGGTVLLPMAGLGSRFTKEGYQTPKPLLDVSGAPMVVQATNSLPRTPNYVFVLRSDMPGFEDIRRTLATEFPGCKMHVLDKVTEGQACTCLEGIPLCDPDQPVMVGACDNGMIYDPQKFEALMADDDVDVIVWGKRQHADAAQNPKSYGWIDADDSGKVTGVAVKTPLKDPANDPVILGSFTFKKASDFEKCGQRLIDRDCRVNGEFYVDSMIQDAIALGLNVALMEVDGFPCWGTPEQYESFNYWQKAFDSWDSHPYSLAKDPMAVSHDRQAPKAANASKPA